MTRKTIIRHICFLIIIVCYYCICYVLNITCPIKAITGISCPTCGMTSALLALLRFDFAKYAEYNIMAAPFVISVVLFLHKKLFNKQLWLVILMYAVLSITLLIYLYRLLHGGAA